MKYIVKETFPLLFWFLGNLSFVLSKPLDNTTFQEAIKLYRAEGDNTSYGPIASWDTSQVSDMSRAFADASTFNANINSWDVSKVSNMEKMFYNAESFNGHVDSWDVSNVTDMRFMFGNAQSFSTRLRDWKVSNVNNMSGMFYNAKSFTDNIADWDVSNVTDMYSMFEDASSFNHDLNGWNVSNTTRFDYMFFYAKSMESQVFCWNVDDTDSVKDMFVGTTSNLVPFKECSLYPQSPLYIISGLQTGETKYCMYPANNFVAPNTKITINTCKEWSSFQWIIDIHGKIHSSKNHELCINMKGKKLTLQKCDSKSRNQQFIFSEVGNTLMSVKNGLKRVGISEDEPADKLPVNHMIATGSDAEKWTIEYVSLPVTLTENFVAYQIVTRLSSSDDPWCFVPSNNFLGEGAKFTISPCKSWKSYMWQIDANGQIKNYANNSMCIGSVFKRMELQKCDSENTRQKFVYNQLAKTMSTMRNGLLQVTVEEHKREPNALIRLQMNQGYGHSYQTWDFEGTN